MKRKDLQHITLFEQENHSVLGAEKKSEAFKTAEDILLNPSYSKSDIENSSTLPGVDLRYSTITLLSVISTTLTSTGDNEPKSKLNFLPIISFLLITYYIVCSIFTLIQL